jgi:hypothetical protein
MGMHDHAQLKFKLFLGRKEEEGKQGTW